MRTRFSPLNNNRQTKISIIIALVLRQYLEESKRGKDETKEKKKKKRQSAFNYLQTMPDEDF